MENIFKDEILNNLEKIKKVFKILNFSDLEIEQHLEKIENILTVKIITTLLKNKGFQQDSDEEVADFIKKNCSPEEIKLAIKKESEEFLRDYFETIFKKVSEEKLAEIREVMA